MGKLYEALDAGLCEFIAAQHVFFVASAPAALDGHVNLSPKGQDCLRVLGPRRIAYLDLYGSGAETIAHARENGRITLLFCAFEGPPKILRLYGRARVLEPGSAEFVELRPHFPEHAGQRSIVLVDLVRIADSCGFGVPLMRFDGQRSQLVDSAVRKGPQGLLDAQRAKNAQSLDGLPTLRWLDGVD